MESRPRACGRSCWFSAPRSGDPRLAGSSLSATLHRAPRRVRPAVHRRITRADSEPAPGPSIQTAFTRRAAEWPPRPRVTSRRGRAGLILSKQLAPLRAGSVSVDGREDVATENGWSSLVGGTPVRALPYQDRQGAVLGRAAPS